MLTEEQKSKLTSEQLVTAERWEREKEARSQIIEEMRLAENAKKPLTDFSDRFRDSDARYCEHDRPSISRCFECNEIVKILYPESFEDETEDV